ncbi:MAG: 3-methyl-2-oxobutanoate hydroxymethyltransferase [Oscillospiraceae bacterium]|nr:3-methyl-2-oxobutanoate hydroxymethyltransferase [Oscillospiraceae bacterium]
MKKNNVATFAKMKKNNEKITMLTSYDYSTAKLVDNSGVNAILVGDSLGNVMLGYEDTVSVTMEDMITFGSAVSRAGKNAMVVIDMPFMSYQISDEQALENAGRLMKEARANAVKLEGGKEVCSQIRKITSAGIPVMAHIGMTPQSVNAFGGFKVQGKDIENAKKIVEDALAVEKAGAFAVVIECVPADLAEYITSKLTIPTIGIGAGKGTDGQVLVYQDMLGMFSDYVPKFVKHYAKVGEIMQNAFEEYDTEVRNGAFPSEEHNFAIDESVMEEIKKSFEFPF